MRGVEGVTGPARPAGRSGQLDLFDQAVRRPAHRRSGSQAIGSQASDGPVLAATAWRSNAELIADVARLGYINTTDRVLDTTYGRGVWWKVWCPDLLIAHDVTLDGVDFRRLPEPDGSFDVVAFDPPYVCVGGRTTTGLPEFHGRFGLTDAPRTPAEAQAQINDGLCEVSRVLVPGGVALVKCADYISSGRLWIGTHHTLSHALTLGFELVDRLEFVGRVRPQPPRTRADGQPSVQVHARRNLSTLFVLRALSSRQMLR